MKNRFIRVAVVTFIVYILYAFFFIDDVIDVPQNKRAISVENNNLENKEDTLLHEKDSVYKIRNK
jgi:cell division septal protein FtsQ